MISGKVGTKAEKNLFLPLSHSEEEGSISSSFEVFLKEKAFLGRERKAEKKKRGFSARVI